MLSVPRYVFLYACNLVIIDLSPVRVTCPCHLKNPINRRRAGIIFDAPARKNATPRRRVATQITRLLSTQTFGRLGKPAMALLAECALCSE